MNIRSANSEIILIEMPDGTLYKITPKCTMSDNALNIESVYGGYVGFEKGVNNKSNVTIFGD